MERVLLVIGLVVLSIAIRALLRMRRQDELAMPIEHRGDDTELAPPKKKKKKKKKKKAAEVEGETGGGGGDDAAATERLRAMLEKISSAPPPRRRHYVFAHQLLRTQMVGGNPDGNTFGPFRTAVESDGAVGPIDALWSGAERVAIAMDGKVDPIDGSPKATLIDEGVLITMPEATNVTEAIFIAIVEQEGKPDSVRYFLLEKGALGRPVFAEWTSSGHANYGNVDSEGEAEFLAKLRDTLKEESTSGEG